MGMFGKWLGGGLGFVMGGPIGGLLGFLVGTVIDSTDCRISCLYAETCQDHPGRLWHEPAGSGCSGNESRWKGCKI